MNTNQNDVLRYVAEHRGPCSVQHVIARCQLLSAPAGRKNILECLGRLMQKKLVVRANRRSGFAERIEPLYVATPAGRALIESGRTITSGPNGPLAAPRKPKDGTFRARMWSAFRISKKATLPELIELARRGRDGGVESNALHFMQALVKAGVAAKLPTRERGYAPSSNGFLRFALIRDLGPKAPSAGGKHLVDPNAEGDARFIAYRGGPDAAAKV